MTFNIPLIPFVNFPAEPIDLPVRTLEDSGGPTVVTCAEVVEENERGVRLRGGTQDGDQVTITISIVSPGVARVVLEDPATRAERVTLAHEQSMPLDAVTLEKDDEKLRIVSSEITVRITLKPFGIGFYRADGRLLIEQNYTDTDAANRLNGLPFGFSNVDGERVAFHDSFTVEPDEHFYGFGEKFTDFDKRGQHITSWHYNPYGSHNERAYKNVPFFISTRGYGVFVDSVKATRFDMASSSHSVFTITVPDHALDYYVIAGPDPKDIITRYAELVSFPNLPPKWAFGLWMSSGFKADHADAVLARAQQLREHDIPCDVLHLDSYWQRPEHWSDLVWNEQVFPDPAAMFTELETMSFKTCLWMNSYLSVESELFEEAAQKGYLLKTPDGDVWVGDLWNENQPFVGIIDVTHPDAIVWWKELLRPHLKIGAAVYKTDFGEGIPLDVVAHNGMTGAELHNIYPLLFNDIVAEVTREEKAYDLVWGRCTFTGGQRHGAQWGGDPVCTYQAMASTLRGGLSMGMCGHALWSHDVGGFHGQPSPDLYVRWAQFGVFSPLVRAHGRTTRLPWDYGEEAERIFRKYVQLRYHLMPYIYTYARLAARTGLPIMRAMVLEFPDDPVTYTMDLQYLLGANLLVAPVYNAEGRRTVYLPAGQWVDYWTQEVITGPQMLHLEHIPLESLPLYVRANTLLPTMVPPAHLADTPFEDVTFEGYVLDAGDFTLEDIDGDTRVAVIYADTRVEVECHTPKPHIGIKLLPLVSNVQIDTVTINGEICHQGAGKDALALDRSAWFLDGDGNIVIEYVG